MDEWREQTRKPISQKKEVLSLKTTLGKTILLDFSFVWMYKVASSSSLLDFDGFQDEKS